MIIVPGQAGKDLCDPHLGMTRRDLLRVGGSGLLGLTPRLDAPAASGVGQGRRPGGRRSAAPGWGKAKSIIMVYLQGGPSHLDLWDPKEDVPDNVRSVFKTIATKVPGIEVTEILPKLAQVTDKFTFIRSMSYTPNGLFNHTAAIYQMMTGYTTDKVSPSGQLEPPSPKDFPNFGSQIIRLQSAERADAAVRDAAPPAAGEQRRGQGGHRRLPGQGVRPVHALPRRRRHGHEQDGQDQGRRPSAPSRGLRPAAPAPGQAPRRARTPACRRSTRPSPTTTSTSTTTGPSAWSSRAGPATRSTSRPRTDKTRDLYGRNTFGQSCLLARRLVEAGTRVVEVIWPKVANSDNHSWDHHSGLTKRMKDQSGPMLDQGLSGLLTDLDQRGMLDDTLVVAVGEFGRSPQKGVSTSGNGNSADGRDHWPYCYTAVVAGAGIKRGHVHGKSDKTGSAPLDDPVHPGELLATIYHAFGIDPATIVYEPPQPAPRAGQGRGRHPAVRLTANRVDDNGAGMAEQPPSRRLSGRLPYRAG